MVGEGGRGGVAKRIYPLSATFQFYAFCAIRAVLLATFLEILLTMTFFSLTIFISSNLPSLINFLLIFTRSFFAKSVSLVKRKFTKKPSMLPYLLMVRSVETATFRFKSTPRVSLLKESVFKFGKNLLLVLRLEWETLFPLITPTASNSHFLDMSVDVLNLVEDVELVFLS